MEVKDSCLAGPNRCEYLLKCCCFCSKKKSCKSDVCSENAEKCRFLDYESEVIKHQPKNLWSGELVYTGKLIKTNSEVVIDAQEPVKEKAAKTPRSKQVETQKPKETLKKTEPVKLDNVAWNSLF